MKNDDELSKFWIEEPEEPEEFFEEEEIFDVQNFNVIEGSEEEIYRYSQMNLTFEDYTELFGYQPYE
ncbi:MAG: hypothetical protein PHG08_00945 [Bacilli bacterium]|nr:hypothetical protein [Bacilli bacterium]